MNARTPAALALFLSAAIILVVLSDSGGPLETKKLKDLAVRLMDSGALPMMNEPNRQRGSQHKTQSATNGPTSDRTNAPSALLNPLNPVNPLNPANPAKSLPDAIKQLCRELSRELLEDHLDPHFFRSEIRFHENRLKSQPLQKALAACLPSRKNSKLIAELDVFSADFKGEKAENLIQVQLSVFSKKSKNKIFETGFHFDLTEFKDVE